MFEAFERNVYKFKDTAPKLNGRVQCVLRSQAFLPYYVVSRYATIVELLFKRITQANDIFDDSSFEANQTKTQFAGFKLKKKKKQFSYSK